jgi:hypothetical protein
MVQLIDSSIRLCSHYHIKDDLGLDQTSTVLADQLPILTKARNQLRKPTFSQKCPITSYIHHLDLEIKNHPGTADPPMSIAAITSSNTHRRDQVLPRRGRDVRV